jgi:hypothetical protein
VWQMMQQMQLEQRRREQEQIEQDERQAVSKRFEAFTDVSARSTRKREGVWTRIAPPRRNGSGRTGVGSRVEALPFRRTGEHFGTSGLKGVRRSTPPSLGRCRRCPTRRNNMGTAGRPIRTHLQRRCSISRSTPRHRDSTAQRSEAIVDLPASPRRDMTKTPTPRTESTTRGFVRSTGRKIWEVHCLVGVIQTIPTPMAGTKASGRHRCKTLAPWTIYDLSTRSHQYRVLRSKVFQRGVPLHQLLARIGPTTAAHRWSVCKMDDIPSRLARRHLGRPSS